MAASKSSAASASGAIESQPESTAKSPAEGGPHPLQLARTLIGRALISIAFPIILVLLWSYATSTGMFSVVVLPTPQSVAQSFVSQLQSGQLQADILSSLKSVLIGYAVGSVLGIVAGVLGGIFPNFYRFFGLVFDGMRQVPPIAWFPFIILWFGIGDMAKIVMVAFGTFFPVLINTVDGVRNTDRSYQDLVALYQVKPVDVVCKVYLPSALPSLLTGLKLGASRAWMSVVGAEMLGAVSGLGYRIATAQQLMRADIMVVDVIVIGVLGWIINFVLEKITARASAWKTE